jgi:hypothetical protein
MFSYRAVVIFGSECRTVAFTELTTHGLDFFLLFQEFLCIPDFYWGRVAEGEKA